MVDCVKGEIHNVRSAAAALLRLTGTAAQVLAQMRLNTRWATDKRFRREVRVLLRGAARAVSRAPE